MEGEKGKIKDPELDIQFTVDQQVKDYYQKKGMEAPKVDAPQEMESKAGPIVPEDYDDRFEIDTIDSKVDDKAVDINLDMPEPDSDAVKVKSRLLLFDYKSEFFSYLIKEIGSDLDYIIVKDFEDLPKEFQRHDNVLLFLNYSAYPRLCQQMIPKVKEKYPDVNMVLVAKNLTAEKVKNHRESPYGVSDYLSFPFSKEDFMTVLLKYS